MSRSKSSQRWLQEHFSDPFVKQAQQTGYRSRAVYKLLEVQDKTKFIRPGMTIIDLGAAPGGWSQYIADIIKGNGRIIALDILPITPLDGVEFLQGDFQENEVLETLLDLIGENKADIVLSDMAPNASGIKSVDQPQAMYLAELALDLAQQTLTKGGDFFVKVFQGEGSDNFLKLLKENFTQVSIKKPSASRSRSREFYILARNYKKS